MPDDDTQSTLSLKFAGTAIYVDSEVRGVLDFYRRAFGLETRFYDPAYEFGELETGGPTIGFASHRTGEQFMPGQYRRSADGKPSGVEVAFFVDDVAAAFRKAVDAGATVLAEPKQMPWGQTVAYVRSIEGTMEGPCTPLAPPAR